MDWWVFVDPVGIVDGLDELSTGFYTAYPFILKGLTVLLTVSTHVIIIAISFITIYSNNNPL